MYRRFKDSLINPKQISEYVTDTKKTVLYFIILAILFIFPNIVYTVVTKGISKSEINLLIEKVKEEDLDYSINNNQLFLGIDSNKLVDDTKTSFAIFFTSSNILNEDEIKAQLKDTSTKKTENSIFVLANDGVINVVKINNLFFSTKIGTYQELNCDDINFKQMNIVDENNLFGLIEQANSHNKSFTVVVQIIVLIGIGMLSLLIFLLLPVFIAYLLNKRLNIKFGIYLKTGIYAFTPYIISTLIAIGNPMSILTFIAEFVSLIYLFIGLNSYYIKNNGGKFTNGL